MEFEALLAQLAFRTLQPQDPVGPELAYGNDLAAERANLILPAALQTQVESLKRLDGLARMSSLAIASLLYAAVAALPEGQVYLNIGVWRGFSLFVGMLAKPSGEIIGVDNFSQFGGPRAEFMEGFFKYRGPRHRFYDLDYVKYFRKQHHEPIGVYFFDGPHRELDQYRSLELAHPFIAPGGLVFVDDSNMLQVKAPTMAFVAQHPEYRVLADYHTDNNGHPTWWNGLIVLRKGEAPKA